MRHSRITLSARRAAVAVLTGSLLVGCTTAAQRQYQAMSTNNQAVLAQAKACTTDLYNSPEAAPLRPHLPLNPTQATLTQLSDPALATPPEITAINQLYPRYKACQQAVVAGLSRSMPSLMPVLEKTYAAGDDDNVLLIQRKISWGERVHRGRDRALAAETAILGEAQQVTAGLEQQHEAELARRQAALDAMARAAQTQQLINALNRPVMTNCTNLGSGMVNCTSY
jgi:hypothetical protein